MSKIVSFGQHVCNTPTKYEISNRTHNMVWECDCGRQWKWVSTARRQGIASQGYWRKTWATRFGLRHKI